MAGHLGQKSFVLLAATWGGAAMNLVTGVLVARVLGPDALGSLGFSIGLAGIVLSLLVPGFVLAHSKRVAEGLDASRAVATLATLKLALYAAVGIVALAAAPWRAALFGSPTVQSVFLLLFAGTLASNFAEIFTATLLARELAGERATVLIASRAARLVATLAVLALVPDIRAVAATFTLEGAVELAGSAVLARRRLGLRPVAPTRETFRSYWLYARPLLVTVPIGMLQDSLDRVLVARWAGLPAAGVYHVARGLWEILGSMLAPPTTFLLARLSALFGRPTAERVREARALFASAVEKLVFVTVPAALVLWFAADPVLRLVWGEPFAAGAPTVRVFVLASLAAALVNPHTHVLLALDAHARFVPVAAVRFVLYLALLAATIPAEPVLPGLPALGLAEVGGALGRTLATLFPVWLYVRWTRQLAGIPFAIRPLAYVAGFAFAALVFHGTLPLASALGGLTATAVAGALGLVGYASWVALLVPSSGRTLTYCVEVVTQTPLLLVLRRGAKRP